MMAPHGEPTTEVDLVLTIRRALAQASRLPPEAAHYVATTAANDAQQSLASVDMSRAVATANDPEQIARMLAGLPPPPDVGALDAIWRAVCLVNSSNSSALAACVRVLGEHVAAVASNKAASEAHVKRCCQVILTIQCHPATTRPMAEGLSDMLVRCSVTPPSTWPAQSDKVVSPESGAAMPPRQQVPGGGAKLEPKRAAPPLPSAWPSVGEARRPPSTESRSPNSEPQLRPPVSPLRRRSAPESNDRALRVRSWLKTLRLHKYCNVLEQMNYEDMIELSETDLEKLGVSAKGARSKILKSITGLKSANQQAEISIAKYNAEVRSGIYADTFAGLATMLEPDQAAYLYGPRPDAFDTAAEFMSTVKLLYTSIVLGQSRHKPQQHDVRRFFSLLDKALRHEHFPVEDKKILFNWKNDCQRILQRFGDNTGRNSGHGGGGPSRQSPEGPWAANTRSPRGGPKGKHRGGNNYDAWSSPTRQQRAASFREQSSTAASASPTSRDRGSSFGSSLERKHSPAPGLLVDPAIRESKSEERLNPPPPAPTVDAFGFGVASIWGSAAEAPATLDPVYTGGGPAHTTSPPGRPRPPGDMRHIWTHPPLGESVVDGGVGHTPAGPGGAESAVFVPKHDAFVPKQDSMDAEAAAWFQSEFPGSGAGADDVMQSIVMGASGAGLAENKRNTATF